MRSILVAVDGTSTAELVVDRVVTLAMAFGACVDLVRVVDDERKQPATERALRRLALRIPAPRRGATIVALGDAVARICEIARTRDADLVAIGAHRHGWVERVLGTTATTLVQRLDRPVLVIRKLPDQETPRRFANPATALREQHARLESCHAALLDAYREGDWPDVCAEWNVLEPLLRSHMALEERAYFPLFRERDAADTERLLSEHDALREQLDTIGVAIELHAFPGRDMADLIAMLRTHAAHEDELFYPWMAGREKAEPLVVIAAEQHA